MNYKHDGLFTPLSFNIFVDRMVTVCQRGDDKDINIDIWRDNWRTAWERRKVGHASPKKVDTRLGLRPTRIEVVTENSESRERSFGMIGREGDLHVTRIWCPLPDGKRVRTSQIAFPMNYYSNGSLSLDCV
ncbi:hypothetical protein CEXT_493861 [Caerostris extrusa]|uniref:Uncharacterized protein n=1 Tax=Caerostris extrusa TaxID=172846 RepID=A0AAV4MZ01_CAEEX|nr:hypothetical protein CEXT_493861 [Caerostris extrusa]